MEASHAVPPTGSKSDRPGPEKLASMAHFHELLPDSRFPNCGGLQAIEGLGLEQDLFFPAGWYCTGKLRRHTRNYYQSRR
jgi:hypothetical protein